MHLLASYFQGSVMQLWRVMRVLRNQIPRVKERNCAAWTRRRAQGAGKFCKALTEKKRKKFFLSKAHIYVCTYLVATQTSCVIDCLSKR